MAFLSARIREGMIGVGSESRMVRLGVSRGLWVRRAVGVLAAVILSGVEVRGEEKKSTTSGPEWKKIRPGLQLSFPRDHGAHLGFQTEWWYLTGEVKTKKGQEYGVHFTIFRRGVENRPLEPGESRLRPHQILIGHAALMRLDREDYRHAERVRRLGAGLASASESDLEVVLEDWQVRRTEKGAITIEVFDRDRGLGFDLIAEPIKEVVAHGKGGVSTKGDGQGNASAYLSFPRMRLSGNVTFGESEGVSVEGEGWLDHEWGTSQLGPEVVGWDWFALRLDSGHELMLYGLRKKGGEATAHSAVTLVGPSGKHRTIDFRKVELTVTETWKSELTGAEYPSGWRLKIRDEPFDLTLRPRVKNAEFDGRSSVGIVYWEGPVEVSGSKTGKGFVELTGYAGSIKGRF